MNIRMEFEALFVSLAIEEEILGCATLPPHIVQEAKA
jgi:hypothetical protein